MIPILIPPVFWGPGGDSEVFYWTSEVDAGDIADDVKETVDSSDSEDEDEG